VIRAAAVLAVLLPLAACQTPAPGDDGALPVSPRRPAPAVMLPTADGPVALAAFMGRPVVLQFADADATDAWAALGDALGDLEAAGATVVAVTVGGAEAEAAAAFGYTGAPLAVVVDSEGTVRDQGSPRTGDDLFRLASPVLAEADLADTVSWQGAETLAELTAAGGVVVDVRDPAAPGYPFALRVAADTMAAIDLPADLGTPLAFVGTGAAQAARRAVGWGYAAVFVADAAGALTPVEAPPRPEWRPRRSGGARG